LGGGKRGIPWGDVKKKTQKPVRQEDVGPYRKKTAAQSPKTGEAGKQKTCNFPLIMSREKKKPWKLGKKKLDPAGARGGTCSPSKTGVPAARWGGAEPKRKD